MISENRINNGDKSHEMIDDTFYVAENGHNLQEEEEKKEQDAERFR